MHLPENKKYAFTTRWDDNSLNGVIMQKSLRKYGWFGTFYLNDPDVVVMGEMTLEQMRGLGRNGDSVGPHSWTHPYLAYTSKNNQFIEITKLRAALEARLDLSVNSHAFAFVNQSHTMDHVPVF